MKISVKFSESKTRFEAGFQDLQIASAPTEAEFYEGSYEVTPKVDAQSLDTSGKLMRKDLMITPIPVFEVSNKEGTTIIIGE